MHVDRNAAKKLFVVSEYVYSGQNSTGYFWEKIIARARAEFSQVNVITHSTEKYVSEKVEDVLYLEFANSSYNKNNIISRLLGQAKQCVGFSIHIVRNVRSESIVLTGTNPALLLIVIPVLKLILRFRWCLLVHDVFPENLVPAGVLSPNSIAYKIIRWFFNIIYGRADQVVVIGRDMKELVSSKIGSRNSISVIQNWVSENDVFPLERSCSELISDLGWQDRVVFQFFGNIGRVQGVDNILAAISLVKSPRAAFLFIGDGAEVGRVKEFISNSGQDNIAYLGVLNQSRKNEGLAACDVALITLGAGMWGLGVPSKAYFSMAADKPLLAVMDESAEVSLMVKEHDIGWTCESANPNALASLIDEICARGLDCMRGRPRQVLQEKFSESVALEKFMICLRNVAHK